MLKYLIDVESTVGDNILERQQLAVMTHLPNYVLGNTASKLPMKDHVFVGIYYHMWKPTCLPLSLPSLARIRTRVPDHDKHVTIDALDRSAMDPLRQYNFFFNIKFEFCFRFLSGKFY